MTGTDGTNGGRGDLPPSSGHLDRRRSMRCGLRGKNRVSWSAVYAKETKIFMWPGDPLETAG